MILMKQWQLLVNSSGGTTQRAPAQQKYTTRKPVLSKRVGAGPGWLSMTLGTVETYQSSAEDILAGCCADAHRWTAELC